MCTPSCGPHRAVTWAPLWLRRFRRPPGRGRVSAGPDSLPQHPRLVHAGPSRGSWAQPQERCFTLIPRPPEARQGCRHPGTGTGPPSGPEPVGGGRGTAPLLTQGCARALGVLVGVEGGLGSGMLRGQVRVLPGGRGVPARGIRSVAGAAWWGPVVGGHRAPLGAPCALGRSGLAAGPRPVACSPPVPLVASPLLLLRNPWPEALLPGRAARQRERGRSVPPRRSLVAWPSPEGRPRVAHVPRPPARPRRRCPEPAVPQVTNEITPVLSYCYLLVLVPVFLLTDYLRYKPVLVLQGLSYVAVWLLLLLGTSVRHMQCMELFYSVTMAARIAYSSYVFSLVRPARYQRMAGYSRAAVLLGVFTSSVLGQLLVTLGRVSFSTLNYVSLGLLIFSLVLALFLKRPRRSLFFNRDGPARSGASPSELDRMNPDAPRGAARLGAWRDWTLVRMLRELGDSLRQPQLRLWSLWWVFNSAAYYLIVYYAHILWNVVHTTTVYNGAADAASTLLGAITSFSAGFVKIRWALWAKLVIASVTAVQAGLVFLMYSTNSIWLCYVAFVLFRGAYQFLVPIATFQIASSLSKELCALVFGVNTFLATVLKTIITLIVSDKRGLGLPVHSQVSPVQPHCRVGGAPGAGGVWPAASPTPKVWTVGALWRVGTCTGWAGHFRPDTQTGVGAGAGSPEPGGEGRGCPVGSARPTPLGPPGPLRPAQVWSFLEEP
uniref:Solute carrier family 19 member 1 n=1 Tax=Canis lupus familiaris TaxID=9615 RepID=A0A8C0MMD8_CANLF